MENSTRIELMKNFIESQNDDLVDLECTEYYSNETIDNINKLLKSNLLINSEYEFKGEKKIYNEEPLLKNILKNISDNKLKVCYKRNKNYGRVWTNIGLFQLRKEIRQTLATNDYIDIDTVNCCYSILENLGEYYNIELTHIKNYNKNRQNILNNMEKLYNLQREINKKLFIIIANGGNENSWLKSNKIAELDNEIKTLVNGIKIEITQLQFSILKKEMLFGKLVSNKINNHKLLSNFVYDLEVKILNKVLKYFIKKNLIIDNDCCLIFDGLMIRKNELINNKLLKRLNKKIYKSTGFDIKFEIKSQDKNYLENLKSIKLEIKDSIQILPLEIFHHEQAAKEFYKRNKDKYIYSDNPIYKSEWWRYLDNNTLYNCIKYPKELFNDLGIDLKLYLSEHIKEYEKKYHSSDPIFTKIEKYYLKALKSISTTDFKKGIIEHLKYNYGVIPKFDNLVDTNHNLFAFNNCLYDHNLKEIRNIEKKDYIKKTTGFDLSFNKNILPTGEISLCVDEDIRNELINFFNGLFRTKEEADFLIKSIAISLVSNNQEKFYILTGTGGNGKSLVMNLIQECFGDYYLITEPSFLCKQNRSASLNPTLNSAKTKRLISSSEPNQSDGSETVKFDVEFIKQITGRDGICSRSLFKDNEETWNPMFTTWLCCNDKPIIPSNKIGDSLTRRLCVIQFPFHFKENPVLPDEKKIDIKLKDKFKNYKYKNEFMLMLLEILINNQKITEIDLIEPLSIKKARQEYIDENNPVKTFLEKENYIIFNSNDKDYLESKILATTLFDEFEYYLESNNLNKISKTKFGILIKECGITKDFISKNNEKKLYYFGLKKLI